MPSIRKIKKRFKNFSKVGKRCSSYASGCPICESYHHLYELGRFPYDIEELLEYSKKNQEKDVELSWEELILTIKN